MTTASNLSALRNLQATFEATFGTSGGHIAVCAPGRSELAGNHTDHQGGSVIAAAVDRYVYAVAAPNGLPVIRVQSAGYDLMEVRVDELDARPAERNTSVALVRGMAAQFAERTHIPQGFDVTFVSDVLPGSGLSSSAAFELALGQAMNTLWAEGSLLPAELAVMAQSAERDWFGKPCGLMDQAAVALGGIQRMNFATSGVVSAEPIDFDFSAFGYAICLVAVGTSHADLTDEYAAIPADMLAVAEALGVERLSQTCEADLLAHLPELRERCSDRALLRALHFFREERLVDERARALLAGDMDTFLSCTAASGLSSAQYLQNVSVPGTAEQPAMLALALANTLLAGAGVCRIHGGGFGGTVQAFVALDAVPSFTVGMDRVFGSGACQVYHVEHDGAKAWHL